MSNAAATSTGSSYTCLSTVRKSQDATTARRCASVLWISITQCACADRFENKSQQLCARRPSDGRGKPNAVFAHINPMTKCSSSRTPHIEHKSLYGHSAANEMYVYLLVSLDSKNNSTADWLTDWFEQYKLTNDNVCQERPREFPFGICRLVIDTQQMENPWLFRARKYGEVTHWGVSSWNAISFTVTLDAI